MTDEMMFIIILIVGFCTLVALMMRHGDYDEQRILAPGIYRVGVEIRPGRCDLVAESGGGSFAIKSKQANAWNLGNPIGATSGGQPSRFRNVTLNQGDILEINGNVRVMLAPPIPILDIKEETLGPGIYRFGVDVPAAKYDFETVSGTGEIIRVAIPNNQYDLYLDMADGHPQRLKTFDNVLCSRRYEIWINGSLQVKLKRSKHQPLFTLFQEDA